MQFPTYTDKWAADDPNANFKAEVAHYTLVDPIPTLEGLSRYTGVPVPNLIRYVLVKYAVSMSEAVLAMRPMVFEQMAQAVEKAEAEGTDEARLKAYITLRQIVSWLKAGQAGEQVV